MTRLLALCAIFLLSPLGWSQSSTTYAVPDTQNINRHVEVKMLMPTTLTQITVGGAVATVDVLVKYMLISNTTSASDTYTIQDADGATYAMFVAQPIAAKTAILVPLPERGLRFRGGVFLSSGSGNLAMRLQGAVR
jgi:hypothetical protein